MAIRIERNEQGNCINFFGSSNPTYWNACLSAEVDNVAPDTVNVINDIITSQTGVTQYEFFRIPYTEFVDAEGNGFADAQTAADYITEKANVIGLGGGGTDLTGQDVCFKLDDTSTSIMLDNGFAYGVNTIKAVAEGGNINIQSELGDIVHFTNLEVGRACGNDGNIISGGLNDVINYLNELFTVGPFEAVVITDPEATTIADVGGVNAGYTLVGSTAIDPIGDGIFTNSSSGNYAGLKSTETIDQVGEYFTFDIQGEGQLGFGLIHSDASYAGGLYSGNANYADPSTFAVSNSAHYGFQFSHWFHPTPNGSWTNYGANTAVAYGPHWSANWDKKQDWLDGQAVKVRVGIDNNGFISVETKNDDGTWGVHARTSYPQLEGAEFHLGIKIANASSSIVSVPKVHLLEPEAPTMYFRYIESPDGVFNYPLFATAEEAEYYDEIHNGLAEGAGSSHVHTYADDPTNTTWYMPEASHDPTSYQYSSAPSNETFNGQPANYTEITSLTNADLTPPQFSSLDYSYEEGTNVNIQVTPQGANWSTSVAITPSGSGLVYDGYSLIQGTLADVAADTTYTVNVTRANSYGSNIGSFDIQATDVVPATPISGFTAIAGSANLIDADTLADGSAVVLDDSVEDGYRIKITNDYVTTNILPNLVNTDDKIYIGFASDIVNGWGAVTGGDFNCGFRFQYNSATSITVTPLLGGSSGGTTRNHTYNPSIGYDFYLSNKDGVLECNYNLSTVDKTNEPSVADGGSFTYTDSQDTGVTGTKNIVIAVTGTSADISITGISEHAIPAAPTTNLTPWTKALDFSGSNEHALKVSTFSGANPLLMDNISQVLAGPSTVGNTTNVSNARPWATAIVFKYDGNSSNQHIWNSGEGAGSTDDNIYLRLDASGYLYFGWGRQGALNECRFIYLGTGANTNHWQGVYIAHNGTRLSGSNATAANLAAAFDIRWFTTNFTGGVFGSWMDNKSTASNWTAGSTGGRMDRGFTGNLTIGGRGSNRNFHGKIASMVITTLRLGVAMPTDAEIELMMTDPRKWEDDYRVGQTVRRSQGASDVSYANSSLYNGHGGTQIWLMGDSYIDSYANGIRNDVYHGDQNYGKLQLNSMVSNDIETVNINGLT